MRVYSDGADRSMNDATPRRTAVTSRYCSTMPTDTFSLIRSLLENQRTTRDAFRDDGKVIARSRAAFVTERPEKSRDDYKRRSRHRHSGFDSLPHVPYKPFADLRHTDAYALIADTWGLSLDDANGETVSLRHDAAKK